MKIPGMGVLKGLKVVFWEMARTYLRGAFTVQYPEERLPIAERYRGRHLWLYDGDKVPRCTACGACVRACPQAIITLDSERGPDRKRVIKRFDIDLGLCMYCGLCIEVCNFHALKMSQEFELATYDRPSLVWKMDELLYPAVEYERTHPHDRKPASKEEEAGLEKEAAT
jgi:NADH-quinone oxidoreductase subunit I